MGKTLATPGGDIGLIPSTSMHSSSQPNVISVPDDAIPSSNFPRYYKHVVHIYLQVSKGTHIKNKNLRKCSSNTGKNVFILKRL